NGNFVSAHTAQPSSPVVADSPFLFVGERFRFVRNSDGTASLRAVNGLFVGVDPADPRRLLANYSSNTGAQTRFDIVLPPSPITVALKSKRNGMFVSSDQNISGRLIADRTEAGPWER